MKIKIILSFLIISSLVYGIEYSGQIKENERYLYKADIAGKIIYVIQDKENNFLKKGKVIVGVESEMDELQLRSKLSTLKNNQKILKLKENNLKIILKSKNKSIFEKNNEKQAVLTLKNSIIEEERFIEDLKYNINKKNIRLEREFYIEKIEVSKNDYVNKGVLLFTYLDLDYIKLEVYIINEDYKNLKEKDIYINNKLNKDFEIKNISLIKDRSKLSTFKIELKSKNLNKFHIGDIVNIEFKNKTR